MAHQVCAFARRAAFQKILGWLEGMLRPLAALVGAAEAIFEAAEAIVTFAEPDFVGSAMLLAVTLTAGEVGTVEGTV